MPVAAVRPEPPLPARFPRPRLIRIGVVAALSVLAAVLLRDHLTLLPVVVLLLLYAASLSRKGLIRFVALATVVGGGAVALRVFVVQPYYIPSESMEPTLHGCGGCNNDHVLVDKLSYHLHAVHAGDVVVFHRPPGDQSPDSVLIKRVVAVGGSLVALSEGRVVVDGRPLVEPYINKACGSRPSQPLDSVSSWRVPAGDVFVMGDNRCNSHDSRAFGPITVSSIVGRAFVIIWPLGRVTSL